MSQTQYQILFVFFLVASLVVIPLIIIEFKKESERKAQERREKIFAMARELSLAQDVRAEDKRLKAQQLITRSLDAYKPLIPLFMQILDNFYRSESCTRCNTDTVFLIDLEHNSGAMTFRCAICDQDHRLFPQDMDSYLTAAPDLFRIVRAYQKVQGLEPSYAGLNFTLLSHKNTGRPESRHLDK